MKRHEEKTGTKKGWLVLPALAILCVAAFFAYVSAYYRADDTARALMQSDGAVSVTETEYGWRFDGPSEDAALIFYPGGKVEETAYAPLLHALAAQGMDACLVRMPFRLAFLDANAAKSVMKAHRYARWYIGGHSLGGVMAASFAAEHGDDLSGVALLAAYPIKKLPEHLTELLVIGSEDRVINRARVERGRAYAPPRFTECVIEGGNHAQFGSYGVQKGDGVATVAPAEQVQQTVRAMLESLR